MRPILRSARELSVPRQQVLGDQPGLVDREQHVCEPGLGVHVVELAGGQQRQQLGESLGGVIVAREQRVLPQQGDDAQGTFAQIVVDGHRRVPEEELEGLGLVEYVVDGLEQARTPVDGGLLVLLEGGEQAFDDRLASLGAQRQVRRGAQDVLVLGELLDVEQLGDVVEEWLDEGLIVLARVVQTAARVAPAAPALPLGRTRCAGDRSAST